MAGGGSDCPNGIRAVTWFSATGDAPADGVRWVVRDVVVEFCQDEPSVTGFDVSAGSDDHTLVAEVVFGTSSFETADDRMFQLCRRIQNGIDLDQGSGAVRARVGEICLFLFVPPLYRHPSAREVFFSRHSSTDPDTRGSRQQESSFIACAEV